MIFPGTGLMPTLQKYCHPLYFERRFIEDLSEQVGYAKGLRAKHGVQLVRREDFAQNIHKTAFILGSGASINNLSEGNWAEIRQNFSIGLNFSLLQDFVPNAYSAETPDYPHDPGFEENERARGLGLIPGQILSFPDSSGLDVPHAGWNTARLRSGHPVFSGLPEHSDFYFVHSYRFVCAEPEHVWGTTDYGEDFCSVVGSQNVLGVQFHPEKSQKKGLRLLENFCEWDGKC